MFGNFEPNMDVMWHRFTSKTSSARHMHVRRLRLPLTTKVQWRLYLPNEPHVSFWKDFLSTSSTAFSFSDFSIMITLSKMHFLCFSNNPLFPADFTFYCTHIALLSIPAAPKYPNNAIHCQPDGVYYTITIFPRQITRSLFRPFRARRHFSRLQQCVYTSTLRFTRPSWPEQFIFI
jgi:hypothetical protein